jgi:hypothetical protein
MQLIRKKATVMLIDPRPCWFRTAIERQNTPLLNEIRRKSVKRTRLPDLREHR